MACTSSLSPTLSESWHMECFHEKVLWCWKHSWRSKLRTKKIWSNSLKDKEMTLSVLPRLSPVALETQHPSLCPYICNGKRWLMLLVSLNDFAPSVQWCLILIFGIDGYMCFIKTILKHHRQPLLSTLLLISSMILLHIVNILLKLDKFRLHSVVSCFCFFFCH